MRWPCIGEIALWWLRPSQITPAQGAQGWHWLADDEKERQQRFLRESDRWLSLATRMLIRSVLSEYAEIPREAWRFAADAHGRPFIEAPQDLDALCFNLSHTRDLVVCAITRGGALGVDIEQHDPRRDIEGIAKRFFEGAECADILAQADAPAKQARFAAYWTLKEAYMKARGLGFALDPAWLSFTLSPPLLSLELSSETSDTSDGWNLCVGSFLESYTLALAARWPAPPCMNAASSAQSLGLSPSPSPQGRAHIPEKMTQETEGWDVSQDPLHPAPFLPLTSKGSATVTLHHALSLFS